MKRNTMIQKASALLLALVMLFSLSATALAATDGIYELPPGTIYNPTPGGTDDENTSDRAWAQDQSVTLADPAPWNLSELKQVVDVTDPRSVAAYWVWAVMRLADNYDDGMEMMKYLFADIEPYGPGYTEGGMSGKAGWDGYFDERLDDPEYDWLPRAYFEGGNKSNGFVPSRPLTIKLSYDKTNTESANATTQAMGRENYIYKVKSNAGGNQVSITVSKFTGSTRWYVTNGASSAALFYDQRSALTVAELNEVKVSAGDTSTWDEHEARYGGGGASDPGQEHTHTFVDMRNDASHWEECSICYEVRNAANHTFVDGVCTGCGIDEQKNPFANPFEDVEESDYYYEPVIWAYENNVTKGTGATTFGPDATCTRGQVVTFLWRAAGNPQPTRADNPFTDVRADAYYHTAVLWAVEQGITAGTSATTFSPDTTCSSAHIATFLYRACGGTGSGWYEVARDWAVDAFLLDDTGMTVSPDEPCPRAAVVTFLYRIYN